MRWDWKLLLCLLYGYAFFIPVSIAISEPIAFFAVPVWLVYILRRRRELPFKCPYFWPMILFLLFAVTSSIWSIRPTVSLYRSHRLFVLFMVLMFPSVFNAPDGKALERAKWAVALFILGTTGRALYDMGRIAFEVRHGASLYDLGNMRDPQMYMVSLCLLVAVAAQRPMPVARSGIWSAVLANAIGLVLHFKRGAWFSFVGVASLMGLLTRRYKILITLLLCAVGLLVFPPVRQRLAMLVNERQETQGGRYVLWTIIAPQMLKEHPWGMGWKAVQHQDLVKYSGNIQPHLNHLHNNILQVAAELGWVGLGIWVIWMVAVLVTAFRDYRAALAAGGEAVWLSLGVFGAFTALLANGFAEYNFGDSEIMMLMCLLMGLSCVVHQQLAETRGDSVR